MKILLIVGDVRWPPTLSILGARQRAGGLAVDAEGVAKRRRPSRKPVAFVTNSNSLGTPSVVTYCR